MADHDPFCPVSTSGAKATFCACPLIARIRADERERIGAEALLVSIARDTYLRAKVEALPQAKVAGVLYAIDDVVLRTDVLALLDGATDD